MAALLIRIMLNFAKWKELRLWQKVPKMTNKI